jgi:hypothetical protein
MHLTRLFAFYNAMFDGLTNVEFIFSGILKSRLFILILDRSCECCLFSAPLEKELII